MANTDNPSGFRPVSNLSGTPYTGGTRKVSIAAGYATALFIGDAVSLAGDADSDGYPTVQQAAAGDTDVFGVITSFDFQPTALETQYSPASTAGAAYVVPAHEALFVVQADGANTSADVGATFDIVVGSGNTSTGISGMELDSSTSGSGNTLQILGIDKRPDNEIGTNTDFIVRFNESGIVGDGDAA